MRRLLPAARHPFTAASRAQALADPCARYAQGPGLACASEAAPRR